MTIRRVLPLIAMFAFINGCADGSPMSPSGNLPPADPPAATRIISLSGDMNFGIVEVGRYSERYLAVRNDGNANLALTGFSASSPGAVFSTVNGIQTVAPGGTSIIVIRFTPAEATTYSGTFTVTGNFTGGANTHTFSGAGTTIPTAWTESGTDYSVIDIPTFVTRVRVVAISNGPCEAFVIRFDNAKAVDQVLGTCARASGKRYEGSHIANGGVEIDTSPSVSWTFTEER
jgi:hypothetical protein